MAKYNIYPNQVVQMSATGNNGGLNITMKAWKYATTIEDLLSYSVDDCGIIETEKTVAFDINDHHLMNVLRDKNITHYFVVNDPKHYKLII